jgi:hypothetical protein
VTMAVYNAFQTFVDEFKNISPAITNTFIFNRNGEIIAKDETTTKEQTKNLICNFNNIAALEQNIGAIENLTVQGADSQLTITAMNNLFLVNVSSRAADQKIVKSLTHVFIPTVANLIDQIIVETPEETTTGTVVKTMDKTADKEIAFSNDETSDEGTVISTKETPDETTDESSENSPSLDIEPQNEVNEKKVLPAVPNKDQDVDHTFSPELPLSFGAEPLISHPPVNQLMVERIGGLLVRVDTVRIDEEVVAKWSDLYEGKEIKLASIETLDGKTTTCKFKPIKEAKDNAKGIIQIPEKILQTLHTSNGKLVMVKPVIEGD